MKIEKLIEEVILKFLEEKKVFLRKKWKPAIPELVKRIVKAIKKGGKE